MFKATPHPLLVPFDGSFQVADSPTGPGAKDLRGKRAKKALEKQVKRIRNAQEVLYASDTRSVLLVFQAMDAAGKDGTIRRVLTGVNPAGCQVFSFKQPSARELDHDFLWRTTACLPERGRIGIFNRSYYEEVLVVRVHPEYLPGQKLGALPADLTDFWAHRFESIRQHELHLARNGTVILKFWLNVSYEEQRNRFIERIDNPEKNWKFSAGDVRERGHWHAYMDAYESALNESSRSWAPWFAIPADDKSTMRLNVATIIADTLENMGLRHPELPEDELAELASLRKKLTND
jgi:PPK2 family polyphosphate:nucleotide phosphotransferase